VRSGRAESVPNRPAYGQFPAREARTQVDIPSKALESSVGIRQTTDRYLGGLGNRVFMFPILDRIHMPPPEKTGALRRQLRSARRGLTPRQQRANVEAVATTLSCMMTFRKAPRIGVYRAAILPRSATSARWRRRSRMFGRIVRPRRRTRKESQWHVQTVPRIRPCVAPVRKTGRCIRQSNAEQ